MEETFTICAKCGTEIGYETAYVSITRSVERADHDLATDAVSIQVINAEEIISLCSSCGNLFDAENISQIVKAIPTDNRNTKHN
jgi:hypothetical protein